MTRDLGRSCARAAGRGRGGHGSHRGRGARGGHRRPLPPARSDGGGHHAPRADEGVRAVDPGRRLRLLRLRPGHLRAHLPSDPGRARPQPGPGDGGAAGPARGGRARRARRGATTRKPRRRRCSPGWRRSRRSSRASGSGSRRSGARWRPLARGPRKLEREIAARKRREVEVFARRADAAAARTPSARPPRRSRRRWRSWRRRRSSRPAAPRLRGEAVKAIREAQAEVLKDPELALPDEQEAPSEPARGGHAGADQRPRPRRRGDRTARQTRPRWRSAASGCACRADELVALQARRQEGHRCTSAGAGLEGGAFRQRSTSWA